jgi:hypothetical protein
MQMLNLNKLGHEERKALDLCYSQMQVEYNQMVNGLYSIVSGNETRLFIPLLSRNIYQSKLVTDCAHLSLIHYLVSNKREIIRTIVVDSYAMKNILAIYFDEKKTETKIIITFRGVLNHVLKNAIYYRFNNLVNAIILASRMFFTKNKERINNLEKEKPITIFDSFMLESDYDLGRFRNHYYKSMDKYLPKYLNNSIYFMPTLLGSYSARMLSKIYKNSSEKILFKQDFLLLRDYFKAYGLLKSNKMDKSKSIYFKGFDISTLVAMYFNKENTMNYRAVLDYCSIKGLKEAGIKVHKFIDWYEAQPIDKALIYGFHKYYPNTQIAGYMGYSTSLKYNFHLCPTDYEVNRNVVPDVIYTNGGRVNDEIRRFDPNIRIIKGPAFRSAISEHIEKKSDSFKILVLMSIGMKDSKRAIDQIYHLSPKKFSKQVEILIKPHPATDIQKVKKYVAKVISYKHTIVKGDIESSFRAASLVVGYGTGAMLEALASGIPCVVIANPTGITQNPIPSTINSKMWRLCYSDNELDLAIQYFLDNAKIDSKEYSIVSEKVRSRYFNEPTIELVASFVG